MRHPSEPFFDDKYRAIYCVFFICDHEKDKNSSWCRVFILFRVLNSKKFAYDMRIIYLSYWLPFEVRREWKERDKNN
jgi:hypothetical protein